MCPDGATVNIISVLHPFYFQNRMLCNFSGRNFWTQNRTTILNGLNNFFPLFQNNKKIELQNHYFPKQNVVQLSGHKTEQLF